ncbi:hypothetical protein DRP53_06025 [candidate division WOR-3 bacterium]|uniref:EamA domain-containing protein n=1 Tax=candidate division WOR-3 bacterium TaxID=2052148 RepID=A0A660SHV1_UNCW3|nr:MAG: hypothetical protein DRP53_06025 [candidate division WOR-3 bacterium]
MGWHLDRDEVLDICSALGGGAKGAPKGGNLWLLFALSAVLVWGFWGYLSKIVAVDLGGLQGYLIVSISSIAFTGAVLIATGLPGSLPNLPLYIITGILGGVGTLFFYLAMESGKASVVVPISAQYIVVAAILAFIFLKEPVTMRKILGIIFATVAIILLSG